MSKVSADNKAIKFPSHHYVGFQSRPSQDNCPLGFMTPDGNDAAAKKRKESVDKWATPYQYHGQPKKEKVPSVTYENKPMVGFKLSREVRRYASFGNGNVKWRIEDPRGFELEISSANFAQILMLCTMEKGEIQDQLIWGRLGSENVLVPVESEVYKTAQANTERAAKKASLKDLNIGDRVVMQNGDEGYFMGVFYFIRGSDRASDYEAKISDKKRYVFAKDLTSSARYNLFAVATPKLSEIHPTEKVLKIEDIEKMINAGIQKAGPDGRWYINENSNESGYILGVTATKPVDSDITVSSTTFTLEDLKAGKLNDRSVMFVQDLRYGRTWAVSPSVFLSHLTAAASSNNWSRSPNETWFYQYDTKALEEGRFEGVSNPRYIYQRANQEYLQCNMSFFKDEFTVFDAVAKTANSGEIKLL